MNKEKLLDDMFKKKASGEKLEVPEKLNLKIKDSINNLPKREHKKNKSIKKGIAAAIIALISVTAIGTVFPAYASNIPVIGSVFKYLSEKNLIDINYKEYASDLNITKTSNGVKVTINSIVYDGIELNVGYTVESNKKLKDKPHILDKEFKINGKTTTFGSGGTGIFKNDYTYVGVDSFDVGDDFTPKEFANKNFLGGYVEIPDKFNLDLNIKEFLGGIKGEWNFRFPVTNEKVKGKVKEIEPNIDLSALKEGMKINKVIVTPINIALRYSCKNDSGEEQVQFIIVDDKGRTIENRGGHASGDGKIYYSEEIFKNVYEDSKLLTFIPYKYITKYYKKIKDDEYKEPQIKTPLNLSGTTTLSNGKYGEYKITNIEFLDKETIVHFNATKYASLFGRYGLTIIDSDNKEYRLFWDNVKEIKPGSNNFVAKLPALSKNKKYTLSAVDVGKTYEIRDNCKFNVKIK